MFATMMVRVVVTAASLAWLREGLGFGRGGRYQENLVMCLSAKASAPRDACESGWPPV